MLRPYTVVSNHRAQGVAVKVRTSLQRCLRRLRRAAVRVIQRTDWVAVSRTLNTVGWFVELIMDCCK